VSSHFGQIDQSIPLAQNTSSTAVPQHQSNENDFLWLTPRAEMQGELPVGKLTDRRQRTRPAEAQESLDLSPTNCNQQLATTNAALDTSARANAIEIIEIWLIKNPDVFPRAEHIDALVVLSGLPAPSLEKLLNEMLRVQLDGGLKVNVHARLEESPKKRRKLTSQIALLEKLSDPAPDRLVLEKAASWVKDRPPKCSPASRSEHKSRNGIKRYQCTLKCGTSFDKKGDWSRHEEQNYPQEGWICDLGATTTVNGIMICVYCNTQDPGINHLLHDHPNQSVNENCMNKQFDARGRIFYRKEHFRTHLKTIHPSLASLDLSAKPILW
jgi:hypothetical protein